MTALRCPPFRASPGITRPKFRSGSLFSKQRCYATTQPKPDERLVYSSLQNLFTGTKAALRKPRSIRAALQKGSLDPAVTELVKVHGLDAICSVAGSLLVDRVFQKTSIAKSRFPDVFEAPANSTANGGQEGSSAPEESLKEPEDSLKEPESSLRAPEDSSKKLEESVVTQGKKETTAAHTTTQYSPVTPNSTPKVAFSPPAVYLPFPSQHRLLTKVQEILEHACYDFAQTSLKHILVQKQWRSPHAGELQIWCAIFQENKQVLAPSVMKSSAEEEALSAMLHSVGGLRHAAVHRAVITADAVDRFMADAEALAKLLDNPPALSLITTLRYELRAIIEVLARNKKQLATKMARIRRNIAMEIARLERVQREAERKTLQEERDFSTAFGDSFEQKIVTASTIGLSAIMRGYDSSPDEEELNDQIEAFGGCIFDSVPSEDVDYRDVLQSVSSEPSPDGEVPDSDLLTLATSPWR